MKLILFFLSTLIITHSCSPINKHHGYMLEDLANPSNLSQFNLETTSESDILQTLGSPSIIINDVNNTWIYLVSIKEENIFEEDDLIYQAIMRYEFDNEGKLISKEFLNEEHFTEITFAKDKTKIISDNYDLADQIYDTFTRGL